MLKTTVVFDSEETKRLFLRYAIPCSMVLIRRGKVSEKTIDELKSKLMKNEKIRDDLEKIFTIAVRMLIILAKKSGKEKIDVQILHEYFWFKHVEAIEQRNTVFKDIPVQRCIVWPGVVVTDDGMVRTPIGIKKYQKDFLPDAKQGDHVVVHYGYMVEKITKKQYDKLISYYEDGNALKKFKCLVG
ncbi:MAG: hypothetical protein B6U68_03245 [Candidatus Aenigmarchaeota archaeon ex4484_14]|nr:MAG: hypothetical protein B6U68_03245 [Candidatus Aenigmarchaeota archaeon ex4484_14]